MRLASIDVGTNSVKLLVADVDGQQINDILLEQPIITRLGQGVDKTGELLPEAMDRTLKVIEDFKSKAEFLGAEEIVAVTTSAMRDAVNRDEFMQKVMDQTGINLCILSGDEEAELIFTATCSDPELQSRKLVLADVGGGSSEFIVGQNGTIEDRFSVNVGCVRVTEEFMQSDPIQQIELQKAFQHVVSAFYSNLAKIAMDDRYTVGIGGTITTLAAIHQGMAEYNPGSIHRYILQKEDIVRMLTHLMRMKLEDRKNVPGLPPQRADVIVAGAAIFCSILEILSAREIIVSTRGLRYGVLLTDRFIKREDQKNG